MSIPTNKIQAMTSMEENDSFMVDTEQGTGRLPLSAAKELMKDVFLAGGVPYGKELTESWADLQARIKAGDFSGIHIGDYKTITLTTGETVVMEVAGIDQYYKCGDTAIGHHIDFISRDCLAGAKLFNDTNTNNGTEAEPSTWRASKLFQTLNVDVYATLPAELKAAIIQKRALLASRYSSAGELTEDSGWAWNDMGNLWIPTEVEVWGTTHWSQPGFGSGNGGCNLQYPIFMGGAKHIIKGDGNGGSRCVWWEASASRGYASSVCFVSGVGYASCYVATHALVRAPLCFRIG